MLKRGKKSVLAISGGPDSVYLAERMLWEGQRLIFAHCNHAVRGKESDDDQRFIERLSEKKGIPLSVWKAKTKNDKRGRTGKSGGPVPGFEETARRGRYRFLRRIREENKAEKILIAHTADDQVETVLMRILEGAGITGLKGIPRRTADGIERPLLDTWRDEIIRYLRRRRIPYRTDKSNYDT